MREPVLVDRAAYRRRHSGVLVFGEIDRGHDLKIVLAAHQLAKATGSPERRISLM